ncbi:MAG: ATP-binding protein [Anaerolineales bacterium]|nr:ATP-binding protein [Anaerolineales bacterium]
MSQTYIPRSLEPVLKKAVSQFPAVVLVGPRQSGKTTLLKHLYWDQYPIVSLEPPDVRMAALSDPRGFLNLYPPPVVFDEIQYAPALLPYIKEKVDAHRDRPGQYILTGSQNLLLMQQVTESLAGRAAVLKLLPMSRWEVNHHPQRTLPWETDTAISLPSQPIHELWEHILRGFYPEIVCNSDRDVRLWQASYVQTYLERDIRNLRNIGNLTLFQTFLRALAARSGQILNLSDLAKDVGVSVNTAKDWISILEASFQIFILRPYYANIGKRLVKSPKVYFTDTGLLCYLVGLRDTEHAASGPMGGAIFENLVVAELFKIYIHRGEEPALYYWRTAAGSEVDMVIETQDNLIPLEIKQSETLRPEMAKEIVNFQKDFEGKAGQGYVIHPGHMTLPLGKGVMTLPLAKL